MAKGKLCTGNNKRKVKLDWLKWLCFEGCNVFVPSNMADFAPCGPFVGKGLFTAFLQNADQSKNSEIDQRGKNISP